MSLTYKQHIKNWWNSLTPKYRNTLSQKYLGLKTYHKINKTEFKELILKYAQIKIIYNKNFLNI